MLSSLPAEDIESVDLYYNAPAKTGIKGSAINFVLKKKRADKLDVSGSVSASDIKSHFHNPSSEVFFSIYNSKLSLEVGYSKKWSHDFLVLDLLSENVVKDNLYIISQQTTQNQRSNDNNIFSRADYDFNEDSRLSVQFSGSY